MPQMSPLFWIPLFILFSISMIMFNYINFFSSNQNKILNTKITMKKNNLNWKW